MAFPLLNTSRLELRQISEDDLDHIFSGLSHPEVIRYYGVNYASREETWEQMEWYAELERTRTGIWWAIISVEEKAFCGAIGFSNLSREHKKAELGFWILPEYWGKGLIREALVPVLEFAFSKLDLHRVEAYVEIENISSQRTLASLFFEQEGILRDSEIKNGRFISIAVFSRLRDMKKS